MTQGLRQHARLRGRWPPPPDADDLNANDSIADQDVLERVYFYPPKHIVLQTKHNGTAFYRRLFLTRSGFAKRLASLLKAKIGRTVAEIGNTEIDF